MRPPRCVICGRNARTDDIDFDLVRFKLTEAQKEYNDKMRNEKRVGHPRGRDWFCEYHLEAAKANTHLTIQEAITLIKNKELSTEEISFLSSMLDYLLSFFQRK